MSQPRRKRSVAIVDDHALVRNGLDLMLQSAYDAYGNKFQIVLQAENGGDFIEKYHSLSEPPEFLFLDINMPRMNGFETMKWISTNAPSIKVLILTMTNDYNVIASLMSLGARAYLTKDLSSEKVMTALNILASNEYYIDDNVARKLIQKMREYENTRVQVISNAPELTENEMMFISLAATELTYREIAIKMELSPRTIDGYRDEVFKKLNVTTRVGLITYAIKAGLIKV